LIIIYAPRSLVVPRTAEFNAPCAPRGEPSRAE
jgi:hypothetical protein